MSENREWQNAYDDLISVVTSLGFPEELGNLVAKNLGSPKAMKRMAAYLCNVKPKSEELVVDEMLAIMSEIAAWRDKKLSEEANAAYNEMLYYGQSGNNCAVSVYSAFSDLISGTASAPRSDGGKCGAFLAGIKVLEEQGKDIKSFEDEFLKQFGSIKCVELRKGKYPCNDLVGVAARKERVCN